MTDYYIKTSDKASMLQLMNDAGFINADGDIEIETFNYSLSIVGKLYDISTVGEVSTFVPLEGYHANLRLVSGDLPECISNHLVFPTTPKNVWL